MKEPTRFSPNALTILSKRYLQPGETPEGMLERASMGNEDYYNMMARLDFLPNSPTLMNLGTASGGTLSACFKFNIADSMQDIMEVARKAALVQKFGGGVGYALSDLRAKGAPIASTHGQACGPVAVLYFLDAISRMVTQGGKRAGAQMGILHCDHPNIVEFIRCKNDNPDALSTFNISVAVTDRFMQRAGDVGSKESGILDLIAESAWRTGDPGVFFIDTAEAANPTPELGRLDGTNPCGEVPLLDNEPCNLGSINLANFVEGVEFGWERLGKVVTSAICYLSDVLEANTFPDQAITDAAMRTKKLGLGVMGWADALAELQIPYDTFQAAILGETVMKFIQGVAKDSAMGLETAWGRVHTTVTCIAPTGTISILADASSGIEPHFALSNTRTMGDGTVLQEAVDTAGFVPKTALEIAWEWHIRHQAAFQRHVDLAVSKTVNMPNSATADDIRSAYTMMWKERCKGGTVYRDGSREVQVLNARWREASGGLVPETVFVAPVEATSREIGGVRRRRLSDDRPAIAHHFNIGMGSVDGYLHAGMYEDGTPGELFVTASKQGSTIEGLLDAFAVMVSISLQHGVPLELITEKLEGRRFDPSGLTTNPTIPNTTSMVDYISRWLATKFLSGEVVPTPSGMECPDCSGLLVMQEGCEKCPWCGWSKC